MVESLIDTIANYKALMEYRDLDFDGDKPAMYKHLREEMADIYNDEDSWLFGPKQFTSNNEDIGEDEYKALHKKESDMITKGKNRIVEKAKDIRQNFSKAVTSGTRSGSGEIVFEFYDKLIAIWGGSANSEPLPFGVRGCSYEEKHPA